MTFSSKSICENAFFPCVHCCHEFGSVDLSNGPVSRQVMETVLFLSLGVFLKRTVLNLMFSESMPFASRSTGVLSF